MEVDEGVREEGSGSGESGSEDGLGTVGAVGTREQRAAVGGVGRAVGSSGEGGKVVGVEESSAYSSVGSGVRVGWVKVVV